MIDQDDLLQLIAMIYDAAVDASGWPVVANRFADAMNAHSVCFATTDTATGAFGYVAPRTDPEYAKKYLDHWIDKNFLWERSAHEPVGRFFGFETFMPLEEFYRTAFYNEWWRPQRMDFALVTNLLVAGTATAIGSVYRSRAAGAFDESERRLFSTLVPHFERAVQLSSRLAQADMQRTTSAAVLDRLDQGALLVSSSATVLFANRIAEAILAEGSGLRTRRGQLAAARHGDTVRLHRMLAEASGAGSGGLLMLEREARMPLAVLVVPLKTPVDWLVPQRPAAIIFVKDPERMPLPTAAQLQTQFGLTPAQARFALEILRGDGARAAAARLDISFATARTHLAQIFEKTGTQRQAELVRLLLQSAGGGGATPRGEE